VNWAVPSAASRTSPPKPSNAVHYENAVGNPLHVRYLVGGEKDHGAIRRSPNHGFKQVFRGSGIQALSRLIENQQLLPTRQASASASLVRMPFESFLHFRSSGR
jgi:hypothetical protein